MKNTYKYFGSAIIVLALVNCFIACEPVSIDPVTTIDDGGGTLSEYKAYTLDSIPGQNTNIYGRVVFWKGLDSKTLIQLSLYNVGESAEHLSAIFSGALSVSGAELMGLYTVTNTKETYDPNTGADDVDLDDDEDNDKEDDINLGFGEFSTSKYFIIEGTDFYDGLDGYDANVQIMMSSTNSMVVATGDIGMNADPIEEN